MGCMEPLYTPEGVEERWQRTWEEEGLYETEPDPGGESFAIALPAAERHRRAAPRPRAPALTRRRARPDEADAGRATCSSRAASTTPASRPRTPSRSSSQRQGSSRQELGREAFEARVWEWLREYGGKIMFEFRRMGASMDYRRERFTMDEGYVRAVMRWFVHLWERGWMYRAHRIINWCPFHQTSLSDLEVEHVETSTTSSSTSATRSPRGRAGSRSRPRGRRRSRPTSPSPCTRTTSGTATLVGREVVVPYVERRVPVVADERVELDFGTGALKVTPGHDPKDYEIGRDHVAAGADGDRAGRADERRGGRPRRPDAGRGRRAGARVVRGARPAGEARAVPPLDRRLRALQEPDRAADLAAVVVRDGWAEAAGARGAARAAASASTRSRSTASRSSRSRSAPDWNISRQLWWGHQLPALVLPGRAL